MPRYRTVRPLRQDHPKTFVGADDPYAFIIRRDLSKGINNRQHPSVIGESQCKNLVNADLTVPGETKRRPGLTLIEDLGANRITTLFGYDPQGFTPNLLAIEGTSLKRWEGTGSFSAAIKSDFATGLHATIVKAYKSAVGEVVLISNGSDNVFEMTPSYTMNDLGDTNTSPPKTTVFTVFRDRVWALKSDLLYYSDASPSDYSAAFDRTTSFFRIPVGEERALLGTRDLGIIVAGKYGVWSLNPSLVPAATDKPEKLLNQGVAAGDTFKQAGDDYMFLSFDGVRGLKRTIQDKLQLGESLPISYPLKDEFDAIAWASISKACAVYWDNKYMIALPVNGSSYNNTVWVYYPATDAWSVISGWNVSDWAVFNFNGEERLYCGEATADGKVYRAWNGATDNSSAINFIIEGRNEDMEHPLARKVGGEIKVVAKPTGDYNISVSVSFDGGGYNLLGTLNVGSHLVTFPTTFPVLFYPDQLAYKKFHLDSYGPWYQIRVKISHNAVTTNSEDITIYEVSYASPLEEYINEEEV